MEQFDIVFLGTGSPLPSAERCGAGHVVDTGRTRILVDCGWGAARRLIPSGIMPASIDTAVFTHMHTDHITDVPDFLFLRWTGGATRPLEVYGPEGTKEMVEGFLHALGRDIGFRLAHHQGKLHPEGINVNVTEVPATAAASPVATIGGVQMESFEVDHFPVVPAFGYRFGFGGRTAVMSGDTSFCESLLHAANGADLFVCEAINLGMMEERIAGLKAMGLALQASLFEDVPSYHLPTEEVARVAREAGVGKLVLSHVIPQIPNAGPDVERFIGGMSDVYGGTIHVARDMERIAVESRASA